MAANAPTFTVSGAVLPPSGACTISLAVRSAAAGIYVNDATGISTTETQVTGPVPASAQLGVGLVGIAKAFSPARITPGGTSTVTLTLTNPSIAQTSGAFTDTLVGRLGADVS